MPQVLRRVFDAAGNPMVGQYLDSAGQPINFATVRDDHVYDCVGVGSGSLAVNTERKFFTDRSNVIDRQHRFSDLASNNKLPPQTAVLEIMRLGIYALQAIGNTVLQVDDATKVYCNAYVEAKLDTNDFFYRGPALGLPSGIGIAGSTGDLTSPLVTNGVPALNSAPEVHPLARWYISENNVLSALIKWGDGTWFDATNQAGASSFSAPVLDQDCAVMFFIRGPIATA